MIFFGFSLEKLFFALKIVKKTKGCKKKDIEFEAYS